MSDSGGRTLRTFLGPICFRRRRLLKMTRKTSKKRKENEGWRSIRETCLVEAAERQNRNLEETYRKREIAIRAFFVRFLLYFHRFIPPPQTHTHTPVLCRLFLRLVEAWWYVPSSREADTGDSEGGMYRTREAFCSSFVVASFPFVESLPLPPFLRTKWVQMCGPPPCFPGRECGFET